MPVWKLDLVFEAAGRGWEESYYREWTGTSFGSVLTIAESLATKRIILSANPVVIKAYRISDPLTEGRQGQAVYFNPVKTPGGAGGITGSVAPGTSINIAYLHDVGNLSRTMPMRGVWDAAVTNFNRLDNDDYGNWYAYFLQYRTYLLQQGFGWMNRPRAGMAQVTYTYAANDLVPTFTTSAPFWPEAQVGTFQYARFSRFNGSNSPLNRELIVYVTSTTVAKASLPIAAGPMTSPGRVLRYGTPVFVAASNIGVTRVGRRAPGAPLLYTAGRSRAQARS